MSLLRKTHQTKSLKGYLSMEIRVVLVPLVPADWPEDQFPLHPPNQPNQLPDNPPDQPNQPPNNPPNSPTLHLIHQIHQISHLTLRQIHPVQCKHKTLHPKYHNEVGHTLSQSFQASQRKMQWHIY